jgi:hypothetical protein
MGAGMTAMQVYPAAMDHTRTVLSLDDENSSREAAVGTPEAVRHEPEQNMHVSVLATWVQRAAVLNARGSGHTSHTVHAHVSGLGQCSDSTARVWPSNTRTHWKVVALHT